MTSKKEIIKKNIFFGESNTIINSFQLFNRRIAFKRDEKYIYICKEEIPRFGKLGRNSRILITANDFFMPFSIPKCAKKKFARNP